MKNYRYITRSSAVAVTADRTTHNGQYSYRLAWNSHSQHEYFLIYSFKLKSAFDACQLFRRSLCSVAKQYSLQQKCLKK